MLSTQKVGTSDIFGKRIVRNSSSCVRPKKIDARILVNLATGMIYTNRRLALERKPRHPLTVDLPGTKSRDGSSHFASLRDQGWKITFWSRARGFETARRRFLSPSHPREPQTGSLMTSELVSFRIKTPESSLLITSSKPTRNCTRPANLWLRIADGWGKFQGRFKHSSFFVAALLTRNSVDEQKPH